MIQILQPSQISVEVLETYFQLQEVDEDSFFSEWRTDLLPLNEAETQFLDKVKAGYFNLLKHPPLIEKTVQIAVLGPMLFLADCFLPPFHVQAEKTVELADEDDNVVIRGQLDILLLKDNFWVMAIESKRASYSVEAGLPQLLSYMLASPTTSQPCYGMITTGGEFIFLKLLKNGQYSVSDQFVLRKRSNAELYETFKILKHIIQI
jgi:hypothetical protein